MSGGVGWRTIAATVVALLAFAANSLLCRVALAEAQIDPWSFTAIRLVSGALALALFLRAPKRSPQGFSVLGATMLFTYALAFSLAYVSLDAGVGALLLFGAVQVTMLGVGFVRGERLNAFGLLGFAVALSGVLVQVGPGLTAPNPRGAALMTLAGLAWGVYSLHGRGVAAPRTATARNFLLAAPLGLLCLLLRSSELELELPGVLLAVASGALTSGLGYVVWFLALKGHSATSAALVQLAVPVLAAAGGITILGEQLTSRLALASLLTLGGIALALAAGGGGRPGAEPATET